MALASAAGGDTTACEQLFEGEVGNTKDAGAVARRRGMADRCAVAVASRAGRCRLRSGAHRSVAERGGGRKLSPAATIELPATASRPRQSISLNGRGPGPLYRWAVFTLHNPTAEPQELVIAAPHQRFVASRVLWPRPEGSRVVGLVAAEGLGPAAGQPRRRCLRPHSAAGATSSYVLEVSVDRARQPFAVAPRRLPCRGRPYAFFRGMVLGIAMLLGIGFICLFIVEAGRCFPLRPCLAGRRSPFW
jgi:hypothetical protein